VGASPGSIRGHFARGFRWTRRVFGSQCSTVVRWRAVSSCFDKLVQDRSSRVERVRPPRNEPASKYRTDFQRIPVGKASSRGERQRLGVERGDETGSRGQLLGVREPVTGPVTIGRAISTDEEGKSEVSSDGGLGAASRRGIASSIHDSVLKGSFRANHPLRMVVEEYKKRGEEVPMVQYVPVQIDGNKAYLRPRGVGLKDSLTLG
jgi:hypothetical protein